MKVLSGRAYPSSDWLNYNFSLADGGEGSLIISKSWHSTYGRFRPANSSIIYIIEDLCQAMQDPDVHFDDKITDKEHDSVYNEQAY